jgi:kynureninase
LLRQVSQHQIGLLARLFDDLDADPRIIARDRSTPLENIAGFLVLRSPRASEICGELATRGVAADHRGDGLRLGPAPYLSDDQLNRAMQLLGEVIRSMK